jgi:hypothetical protein
MCFLLTGNQQTGHTSRANQEQPMMKIKNQTNAILTVITTNAAEAADKA